MATAWALFSIVSSNLSSLVFCPVLRSSALAMKKSVSFGFFGRIGPCR